MEALEANGGKANAVAATKELDDKFAKVEAHYFQPLLAEGDLKSFRAPNVLYSQLSILAGDVGNGSADFPPTTQMLAVHEELKEELATAEGELHKLLTTDLPAFNQLMGSEAVKAIVTE